MQVPPRAALKNPLPLHLSVMEAFGYIAAQASVPFKGAVLVLVSCLWASSVLVGFLDQGDPIKQVQLITVCDTSLGKEGVRKVRDTFGKLAKQAGAQVMPLEFDFDGRKKEVGKTGDALIQRLEKASIE